MLSQRGQRSAASQDIPWRFAPEGKNPYDPVTNPSEVISFASAENVSFMSIDGFITSSDFSGQNLVQDELAAYVAENVSNFQIAHVLLFLLGCVLTFQCGTFRCQSLRKLSCIITVKWGVPVSPSRWHNISMNTSIRSLL